MAHDDKTSTAGELLDGQGEAVVDPVEQAEAEALARAIDAGGGPWMAPVSGAVDPPDLPPALPPALPLDLAAVGLLRAASGRAALLGELRARSITRGAMEVARRRMAARSQRRSSRLLWVGAAAALLLAVAGGRLLLPDPALPEELCSRSAGLLVPGPFPPTQGAAERLDRVTEDRLLALREVRYRALAGGRR